jgi:hypothetical protein
LAKGGIVAKDFEEGKNYLVSVTTQLEGVFSGYEMNERGHKVAVFNTGGSGRHGIHQRKVPVHNIIESVVKKY